MRYTTEWAKQYLREHRYAYILQIDNLEVYAVDFSYPRYVPKLVDGLWCVGIGSCPTFVGKMLEHPDGWQNSKVTREDL